MQRPQPSPHSTTSGSTNRNSNAMSTTTALFTASEHHAFDAFLTASVEPPEDEWQLYTQLGIPVPLPPQGNSSLTKATKDLIALHPPSKYPPIHGGPNSAAGSSSQPMLNSMAAHHRPIAPAPPPELAPRPQQQQYHQPVQQSHVPSADRPPKRARHSHASSTTIQSPSPTASQPTALTKPALLSAQQKKANHIQSEQKRRANIRRGYEALCETIPALREAIRAEEEAATTSSGTGKKRRARDEGGEKVDGRAGPRSESVVLQKTIEHLQDLLEQKSELLSRLERTRSILGPNHPALRQNFGEQPLWEREWDGGKGIMVDVNGDVLNGNDSDED